ncbi:hypothetical protein [Flavobacterium hungaricum]|uniref:Uncharacterized protein n=1 Tax=Flavobacterium hungaricum TaxID=2082725 RepID=A0ABR9TS82_9FLAO|nr:hypothetical protein [Flavobacterium hungaricum]MBE8728200.1 hypothetical protein [Flavobacterium hungaricum]
MRKVFGITMTILFLLVSFQQALIVVHFKLNQKNIEKEFCVNKAKPKMQCHGQCHLKKELEKSEKSDLELTGIGKKIDINMIQIFDFSLEISKTIHYAKKIVYKEWGKSAPSLEIFVPPPIL